MQLQSQYLMILLRFFFYAEFMISYAWKGVWDQKKNELFTTPQW